MIQQSDLCARNLQYLTISQAVVPEGGFTSLGYEQHKRFLSANSASKRLLANFTTCKSYLVKTTSFSLANSEARPYITHNQPNFSDENGRSWFQSSVTHSTNGRLALS